MNKREGKAKVLSSFRKDVFSIVLTSKLWAFLAPCVKKKKKRFWVSLVFRHERSSAVNMQDKEWLRRLLTPDPSTVLWACHLLTASLLASDSKLYKEQKTRFIFHRSLCIFHNILFISILINTKRHCDFFFFKRKQWVLKRHENALDIRNINLNFGMFFYWHLVLRWMNQHIFFSFLFFFFLLRIKKVPQQKKKKRGRQNRTWEGYFCQWKWNGIIKWRCVWIYTHIYTYINTTRM